MPSPSSNHLENPTPPQRGQSPKVELQEEPQDTSQDTISNGQQQNGGTMETRSVDSIQEVKEQAKAVVAASDLPSGSLANEEQVEENAEPTIVSEIASNGTGQSRKRSRSGTRISHPTDRPTRYEATKEEKKLVQRKLLEQYVNRDMMYAAARKYDDIEHVELQKSKRREKEHYISKEHQHQRHLTPGVIFGPGYADYGNGTTNSPQPIPPGRHMIIYPLQRKRPGGRKAKQLRVPKKEVMTQSEQLDELIPIRLDIEWDKIRLRDTFTWNLHDRVVTPELFAEQLIEDFKLPLEQCRPLVQLVCSSIKEQIQDFYPQVFIDEEALDPHLPYHAYKDDEMRITIKLNITIGQHTLVDQFDWEINNPMNSAEDFARQMTRDLSLCGEFTTAIAHSIREQSQLFTRSLYVTGHPFDGRPVEDQELKASFLASPLPSPFRPYQAAKDYTPYLYELNETELEKSELSLSREERRQKRSVNRRGGPALPDLKDRRRTIRTLVVSSVIPGAADTIENSRILKRAVVASGKGRQPGHGHKEGLDESDDSESDDSSADSPAVPLHLQQGTARTRGMRGAATLAQAAVRGAHGRSATPEASTLHHHETRTSGRRFGGKDYREESVDDSPTYIIKLRVPRERYKQLMKDLKTRSKPESLQSVNSSSHISTRRSLSETPAQGTPIAGSMGPPPTTPGAQAQSTSRHHDRTPQQQGTPSIPIQSIHPHAAQIGRVDAVGPPSPENPIPTPPQWLTNALNRLQHTYPSDAFEGTMRYTAVSTLTDLPISVRPDAPTPENVKYMYYPRIKCKDCPGKLYTPGPEMGVNNFEVHLKNRIHREKVERRVQRRVSGV